MKKNLLFSLFIFTFSFVSCKFAFDAGPDTRAAAIVPVEEITGVTTGGILFLEIPLTGTIIPEEASNKKIVWTIKSDGGTNATLDGNKLTANAYGTITVTATITDGLDYGLDYTQDFPIAVTESGPAVSRIDGIPSAIRVGDYEIKGMVFPTNTLNTKIEWSVKNAGTTGVELWFESTRVYLTATAPGTLTLTATIADGWINADAVYDFTILVSRPVYAVGLHGTGTNQKAGFWIDKEFIDLHAAIPGPPATSLATGIAYSGGKTYISGSYGTTNGAATACYWVVDGAGAVSVVALPVEAATNSARGLQIAAEGATVYITGLQATGNFTTVAPASDTGRFHYVSNPKAYKICYWKIVEGESPQQVFLPGAYNNSTDYYYPEGKGATGNNTYYDDRHGIQGRFAVKDGVLYIPFRSDDGCFLWDGADNVQTLDPDYEIYDVKVVNDQVYMAGNVIGEERIDYDRSGNEKWRGYINKPFYVVMGGSPVIFGYDAYTYGSAVYSIIEQNGRPYFYGVNLFNYFDSPSPNAYYWDETGAFTLIGRTTGGQAYKTQVTAFADGLVYMFGVAGGIVALGGEPDFLWFEGSPDIWLTGMVVP